MTIATATGRRPRDQMARIALLAIAAASVLLNTVNPTLAQSYPSRLIKFVVPLTAGSPIDVLARLTAPALSARFGQNIIVENRPGGGGTIATKAVATAAPDGYTLLFTGVTHTLGPATSRNINYDPVKDFAPIATVGTGSWVLVVAPSLPIRSVSELVAYAKANPKTLNWGFGVNTGPHLLGEMFKVTTGIDIASISYKGGAQVVPDMLGGRIQMNFAATATLLPLIQEGKLRALAITSKTRNPDLPDVPTMIESGLPRLTLGLWAGLLAPAGTPADIINRLNTAINVSVQSPPMNTSMVKVGFDPKLGSPQDFVTLIIDEIETWGAAAKSAGIQPE